MQRKYSKNFERDWDWYVKYKDQFTFDGSDDTMSKVLSKEDGKPAKECFHKYDSEGKIIPTNEAELLFQIFKAKGSINFHIKNWSEDRVKGYLPRYELDKIIEEFELLDWMITAIENQTSKLYKQKLV